MQALDAYNAQFLSTPSVRRATMLGKAWRRNGKISIHALREEGDADGAAACPVRDNFYPRPP